MEEAIRKKLLVAAILVVAATAFNNPSSSFVSQSRKKSNCPLVQLQTTRLSLSTIAPAAAAAVNGASNNLEETIRLNVNEKARTVTSVCTSGTLCTTSCEDGIQGAPFGSFVDYVLDDQGNPVLLMNDMSMHTVNIQKAANQQNGEPALVTLFTQLGGNNNNNNNNKKSSKPPKTLQDVSRVSLTGTLTRIDATTAADMDAIRMRYSLTHAYADQVMDSPKFSFYRLVPKKIYFVGGFGVLAKWVDPEEYRLAAPDILAQEASSIIANLHSSNQHAQDLVWTAQHLLGVSNPLKIRVTNVDRLGFDVRVTSQTTSRRNLLQTDEFRIGFRLKSVVSVEDAKSEILKIFQEAWEKAHGYEYAGNSSDDELPAGASVVPILKIAADSLE